MVRLSLPLYENRYNKNTPHEGNKKNSGGEQKFIDEFSEWCSIQEMQIQGKDPFATLRAKYREEIKFHQGEIAEIESKIKWLEKLSKDAEGIPATSAKYAGVKLTEALLDAVCALGTNGGISAAEVRRYLVSNGYQHSGQHFKSTSLATLRRLAVENRIGKTMVNGIPHYMVKQ